MPNEPELSYTREPICPYCGASEKDAWEINFGDMEGTTETECGSCGKEYSVTRNVSVSYNTAKIEERQK